MTVLAEDIAKFLRSPCGILDVQCLANGVLEVGVGLNFARERQGVLRVEAASCDCDCLLLFYGRLNVFGDPRVLNAKARFGPSALCVCGAASGGCYSDRLNHVRLCCGIELDIIE